MQTFLPYPDFQKSLACLDNKRLGKQRVEAKQILDTLTNNSVAWRNHPAVLMWEGHTDCLALYYNLSLLEWAKRGYRNIKLSECKLISVVSFPYWLGNETFHASHRSNLLRKKPEHYSQFNWEEPDNLPYFWPERIKNESRTN